MIFLRHISSFLKFEAGRVAGETYALTWRAAFEALNKVLLRAFLCASLNRSMNGECVDDMIMIMRSTKIYGWSIFLKRLIT